MNKKEVLEAAARGEGCLGKCADNEPVFVICARDVVAPEAVEGWARLAQSRGAAANKIEGALEDADAMRVWQDVNGSKIPD